MPLSAAIKVNSAGVKCLRRLHVTTHNYGVFPGGTADIIEIKKDSRRTRRRRLLHSTFRRQTAPHMCGKWDWWAQEQRSDRRRIMAHNLVMAWLAYFASCGFYSAGQFGEFDVKLDEN